MDELAILRRLAGTLRAFVKVLDEVGPAYFRAWRVDYDVEALWWSVRGLVHKVEALLPPSGFDPDDVVLRLMMDEVYHDVAQGRFQRAVARAHLQTYDAIGRAGGLDLPADVKRDLAEATELLLDFRPWLLEEPSPFSRDYDRSPREAGPVAPPAPSTSESAAPDDEDSLRESTEAHPPPNPQPSPSHRPSTTIPSGRAKPVASPAPSPMGGEAGEAPAKPKIADKEYQVWYGTNRRPVDPANASRGYSSERDTKVHYGTCRVFIPASHKIGSIGSGWWKRLFSRHDDRLKLQDITELGDAFWERLAQNLRRSRKRTGIVFVHGYNVSFEEAALRAAQIGTDLSFKGAMAFFSWPSKGNLVGYGRDGQTIEASKDAIATFLVDFAEKSGARSVHVIAHSMGNRGVLGAINKIAQAAQGRTAVSFGQFILAAADVDADVFRNDCQPYLDFGRRTTLYVSGKDMAVEAASWLYDYPRVGFLPPVVVLPGIDTVAVTNIDLTLLGHGYIAQARDVLKDMHALISDDQSPDRRFGLREARTPTGDIYWEIGA